MTSPQLYFAYGSNLNHGQMRDRCPGATLIGRAHLQGYSLAFDEKGCATLAQYPKFGVHGAVWQLDEAAELALDEHEGVSTKCYRKDIVTVTMESGEPVQALTYISMRPAGGSCDVRPGYAQRILQGLADCQIAPAYTEGVKKQLQPKVVDLSGLMAHLSSHELGDLCSHRDALQGLRRRYPLAASAEADTIIMAAKHEFSSREHRSRI